jgi:hypothetical protein
MDKCINFSGFLGYFFDHQKLVKQAAQIVKALLEAQSPRLSNIAEKMPGQSKQYARNSHISGTASGMSA